MTSTEFARRYRLLKNVANRGARSFLAQQVDLGRMVMVHYLDSESPQQRIATLARLDALTRPARDKLLEIADVDGSPVAVTLFISSFADFTTWLDSVSSTTATPVASAAPVASPPSIVSAPSIASAPPPHSAPTPEPAGDFTMMFGKLEPPPVSAPAVVAQPRAEAAPPIPSFADSVPPAVTNDSASGFTAIFGAFAGVSDKRDLPQALPQLPDLTERNRVMPRVAAQREVEPTPAPARPEAPPPGEFTQLFQRLSPSAAPSSLTTNGTVAAPSFDSPRSLDTVPHGDMGHAPSATPELISGYGGSPAGLRAPALGAVPSSSPSGNIMSRVGAESGPSEFTRILSPIVLPSAQAVSSAPAAAPTSEPSAQAPAAAPQKKSMLPMIVALNIVVLLTIAIVAYFVLRR